MLREQVNKARQAKTAHLKHEAQRRTPCETYQNLTLSDTACSSKATTCFQNLCRLPLKTTTIYKHLCLLLILGIYPHLELRKLPFKGQLYISLMLLTGVQSKIIISQKSWKLRAHWYREIGSIQYGLKTDSIGDDTWRNVPTLSFLRSQIRLQ